MPSIETSIWRALKSRVATISGYAANQFDWPLEVFDKPQSSTGQLLPYLEVRHLTNDASRLFIKSVLPHERPGILQVALMWPASSVGDGAGQAHPDLVMERAGQIAAHFPTDFRMEFGGLSVRVQRTPDVSQPIRDENYWKIPVSIRWVCYA